MGQISYDPHDQLIRQFIHRERTRPYKLFITNAAATYDPEQQPAYVQRGRCASCVSFGSMDCGLYDPRPGAEPGRLLIHGRHLYTGTFRRFARWDAYACGADIGKEFGYGRCRSFPFQGQIAMGHLSLTPGLKPGNYKDRYILDSRASNAYAHAVRTPPQTWNCAAYHLSLGRVLGTQYDMFVRFKLTLPADAVILEAKLWGRRFYDQDASCFLKAYLLDRDSMNAFSTVVGHADNPARSNVNGPARINCSEGSGNEYELPVEYDEGFEDSGYFIPHEIIGPIVAAFLQRPGYDPNGSYLGVALQTNETLNATNNNNVRTYCYHNDPPHGMILLIRWREASASEHGPASTPPRLKAYEHVQQLASPVPEGGTWPEERAGIDAGAVISPQYRGVYPNYWDQPLVAGKIPDQPWASSYRYVGLIPVDPLASWWSQEVHGDAPYPADAHNDFPLEDCETYEIPCYKREAPWRYRSRGDAFPSVRGGLPGIIGFSSAPAQHGMMPIYVYNTPCDPDTYAAIDESTWRLYRGQTQSKRYYWTADPQQRGWFVQYTAFIKAWFACDGDFLARCNPLQTPPDGDACQFRWTAWYQIEIRASFPRRADVNDEDFKAFVLTHKAAFGAIVTPRYSVCNDVLRQCAGIANALGDNIWPPEDCQNLCVDGVTFNNDTKYPPCKHEENAPSYWYLPDWNSDHVKSPLLGDRIPALPELGLYHETTMVRQLNAQGTSTEEDYGWAILFFQTNMPWLLSAEDGLPEVQNEIHTLTITNPNGCSGSPTAGGFRIGWGEDEKWWSLSIARNATAAQVKTAIEACDFIGSGNASVTGSAGGPWSVEYVGELAGKNMPQPELMQCDIRNGSNCHYSVEIATVQQGSGMGT